MTIRGIGVLLGALMMTCTSMAVDLESMNINKTIEGSEKAFLGLRFMKPVLKGVLYRGGAMKGNNKHPMTRAQVTALCEAGFSQAGYLYTDNFPGKHTVSCGANGGKNDITYATYGYRNQKARHEALKVIYDIIKGNRGPMYIHCWNGWHASGEIAAVALMQFCGWSGRQAGEYWIQNIGDKMKPAYNNIPYKHIPNFEVIEEFRISRQEQERICP